jgi:hypothetical protein
MLKKDEILERTNNGLNVFKHYISGNWRIGRNSSTLFIRIAKLRVTFTLTDIVAFTR